MNSGRFIFSTQLKHRLARHLLLWTVFSFYFFIVSFFPRNATDFFISRTYLEAFRKMIYIPIGIFSVYTSIYFLLPQFLLKGKYVRFFALFFGLSAINVFAAYMLTKLLAGLTQQVPFQYLPVQTRVFQPVIYGLGLGLAASGFAIIIKLLKIRYLTQKKNERLKQQKISTELQMMKSNFHPQFLSDALQNISDLIRQHSPKSPETILKLSDLLSYILYENEEESISLEKELMMVRAYLDLEKTFYGNRIVFNVNESGNFKGKVIAPLILLSLVQNCCEQFLISLQQKLTIDIETISDEKKFVFHLKCNGYYEGINGIPRPNTGLNQALRRIEMVYPGKHKLETHSKNSFFSMALMLEPDVVSQGPLTKTSTKLLYEEV